MIDLWGPMACFTPPMAKVERYSYPVPTPSAIRGALASIYSKPEEFYWMVKKIEVMRPIQYMLCKRNELKSTIAKPEQPIDCEDADVRTQRTTMFLKDVRYRVTARLVPRQGGADVEASLRNQAKRRIESGQCFLQPYLGLRECTCYFELASEPATPIQETMELGMMVFDTHVPGDKQERSESNVSLYQCSMVNGVIEVPDYESDAVLKIGRAVHV